MKQRTLLMSLAFMITAICLFAAAHFSYAATPGIVRIFYYRQSDAALQSLKDHYASIDVLAPQFYAFNSNGALEGDVDTEAVSFAIAHGVKVMPLITNKGFSVASLAILSNPVAQNAAIVALTTEAKKMGYSGYQLDFEQIDLSYKDKYTAFAAKLHDGLKSAGLSLSVAVVAKTSDNPADYNGDLWQKLIGAYDYTALSNATDFISIMSYDDPASKGPVTRYPWLQSVLTYSLAHIPADKISLGIPLYYWKWNDQTSKLVGIGGYDGLQSAFKRPGATIGYSPILAESYVRYTDQNSSYSVWYEDEASVRQKLNLITTNHLNGFSAWALGQETPGVFTAINSVTK